MPGQRRSAETVSVILEAAARILETRGLDEFTTNVVAELAGVSIGSLYQYFPAKEALTAALIRQESAVLLADVASAARQSSGRAALTALIGAAVKHQLRRPALARLLDFEEARLPVGEEVRRVSDEICSAVVEMLRSPDVSPQADVAVASADLFAIVKGMIDSAGQRGETNASRLQARVERAVFGYLDTV